MQSTLAAALLKTPIEEEVFVQPPHEFYHNRPLTLWVMKKARCHNSAVIFTTILWEDLEALQQQWVNYYEQTSPMLPRSSADHYNAQMRKTNADHYNAQMRKTNAS
eukprot:3819629-Amphidinium_carterae.6